MTEERKMYLQLFAEDEDVDEVFVDEEELEEGIDESEEEEGEEKFSQEDLERVIGARIARERTKWERRMKKLFGTTDLQTAAEYYRAGHAVSRASNKPPQEVIQRVAGQAGVNPPVGGDLGRELSEIRSMLEAQHERESRDAQESEARKEFGTLYDDHYEDIIDMADERGLSLADAAAVVLRPHLSTLYEEKAKARAQSRRSRKVEGTGDAPSKGSNVSSKLSASQKRTAQKMGVSYKDYYTQLKELGRID